MEIETLKTEVTTEVQKRAEELAKDEIRNLTLAKKRAENLVKTAQAEIVELDKEIAEVKIEDFTEDALSSIDRKWIFERGLGFAGHPEMFFRALNG